MKFVPVIHCPECKTPYTSNQLGFDFVIGRGYTVVCHKCGTAFDFSIEEEVTEKPRSLWQKVRGVPAETKRNLVDKVKKRVS